MKGNDFAQLLTDFADVLSEKQAQEWRAIPRIFEAAPADSVVAICSVLSGVQPPERGDGSRLREMVGLISALKRLLSRTSAKKAVDDLQAVETALTPFSQAPTAGFAAAAIQRLRERVAANERAADTVPTDVVQTYLHRLEETLRDPPRFAKAYDALENDKAVKTPDIKKLAREFAKETAKSRRAALDLIWARHAALMGSRARKQATKGRTAA
jgi:hypothetical protein